jgi:hypothetical protein
MTNLFMKWKADRREWRPSKESLDPGPPPWKNSRWSAAAMSLPYTCFNDLAGAVKGFSTRERVLLVAGVALGAFCLVVNNSWKATPDSALYLELGQSLAHGRGYLFNGEPHTYVPPGFPAMAAVWTLLFGESFLACRTLMALMGLLTAGAGYLLMRKLCGEDLGLLVGGLFAVNHVLLENATYTASDVPFALFTLLGSYAVVCAVKEGNVALRLLAASILLSVPPLIRVNGWAVAPAAAVFLFLSLKDRTWWKRTVLTLGFLCVALLPGILWELHKASFPASLSEGTYYNAISTRRGVAAQLQIVGPALWEYVRETSYALTGVVIKTGFLECLVPLVALIGMVQAVRSGERFLSLLVATQFAGLVLAPAGSRYLLPLIPALYLFFGLGLFSTAKRLAAYLETRGRRSLGLGVVVIAVFLTMGVLNVGHNVITVIQARSALEAGGGETERDTPFFAAARWLRANTQEGEVVLSMHPRILHFLSGRPTAELVRSGVPEHEAWVDTEKAIRGMIESRNPGFLFSDSGNALFHRETVRTIEALGLHLREIPEAGGSGRFHLYRLLKAPSTYSNTNAPADR